MRSSRQCGRERNPPHMGREMSNTERIQRMVSVKMSIMISHVSTSTYSALSMILNDTGYDGVLSTKTGTSSQGKSRDR